MPISTFSDKVAAITGTGSGIGEALAISLAQQGCAVAIADIDNANLQKFSKMGRISKKLTKTFFVEIFFSFLI